MTRWRPDFGGLNRMPVFVCSRLSIDAQGAALEIDVFPPYGQHLAAAHSGRERQQHRPIDAAMGDCL